EDPTNEANIKLRQALLRALQQNPDILYNNLLSWLFVQQKDYKKALAQEKAIYKRTQGDLKGIKELLYITLDDKAYGHARDIAEFMVENAAAPNEKLLGEQNLIKIDTELATQKDYPAIETKFQKLFEKYGTGTNVYALQMDYNTFLAFKVGKQQQAIKNLKTLSQNKLGNYKTARVKMLLADILVYSEKFNQALIYYSQVQKKVKNDPLAQQARFKVAQTSYYKGDFAWAQTQLDVLKKSTSQLIANDAMQLSLTIRDNSLEDSTQTALKKFAAADLLALQLRYPQAITAYQTILTDHKGEKIEDETLFKQGRLFEKTGQYERAEHNYLKIIQLYGQDILADDAHYYLAQLYE
ncbi:MAG: tetratricopeptide repeat protein, partial [Marinirhabdus sp.]